MFIERQVTRNDIDQIITIWRGTASSKPLSFGVSTATLGGQEASKESESYNSPASWLLFDDEESQGQ